jgi:hypothetical protein
MRPLNGGYAQYFNKKYNRRGYLFQDRYKSVLCQDQEYALQLIRYIHLNPLRGGLVSSFSELADWQWCGHGNLVNEKEKYGMDFQNKLETLRRFGKNPEDALGKYISYLREGIVDDSLELSGQLDHDGEMELRGSFKGWPAVVGNPEFVRSAMERHHVSKWRVHRKSDYNEVLQNIAKSVCDKCGITKQQLFQKGRQNQISLARELFCYEAFQEEKIPYGIIANFLGVTIPPVTYLVRKGGKMGA